MHPRTIETDVLVLGSGLAGLLAALELSRTGLRVVLACKGALSESNSSYAQGGVAAVLAGSLDHPDAHLEDTVISGAGLCDKGVAREIIEAGAALITKLVELGVEFDRKACGGLAATREGGHSRARVVHRKDTTGRAITSALIAKLKEKAARGKTLTILEYAFASELLVKDGTVYGATLLDCTDQAGADEAGAGGATIDQITRAATTDTTKVIAAYTVLATGGIGQIFERTTNPLVATGDGIALAYRAGALLRDMEFVQFHPTALCLPGAPAFLISEAVRGEGAVLLDSKGHRFMPRFHKDAELATRDIVARAIHSIMIEQDLSAVGLDMRPIGKHLEARFPAIVAFCKSHGIDPATEPVPICPAAHYFMGGIVAEVSGRTTVDRLYAIGECASTGLHGANRLASNSLLEAGVSGSAVAADITKNFKPLSPAEIDTQDFDADCEPKNLAVPSDIAAVKTNMYRFAGLVRTGTGLKKLLARLHKEQAGALMHHEHPKGHPQTAKEYEAANMLLVADLIATAALNRCESRGGHFRGDHPDSRESFRRHQVVSRAGWNWQDVKGIQHGNTTGTGEVLLK
ncbi:MAG: L-aspartate oxidase [Candidatus Melainabacteria bacterium]|nr:L-aspartate oxidase [Candidatus Melainabacteria bacterium]